MLFHSSLRKELAQSFGATLVVLVTVVMTFMLIRSLGQASSGSVNPSEVMMVMGYSVLGQLPTILVVSLFIAILTTLSRMYADSEMVIWFSAGRGLGGFAAPVFRFAWPVLVVITVLALAVWPWTNEQTRGLRHRFEKRGDLERVSPGLFQESAGGSRVFFIDKDTPNSHTGKNVFISSTEHGKETVTSARSGKIDELDGGRFLTLSVGQRVESVPGQPDIRVSEFEEYGARIGDAGVDTAVVLPPAALNSLELLQRPTPQNMGELAWRMGLALGGINFVLIALASARVNPRVGRSGNLLFAMFAFFIYYDFINLGQSWISNGKTSFLTFMLSMHGGVFALALIGLLSRHYQWHWRDVMAKALRPNRARPA